MEQLRADETMLQGYWLDLGSRMVPDSNWERIDNLTSSCLELLATADDGTLRLYRDPTDNRYWERRPVAPNLPQGPPILESIDIEQARQRFPQAFAA